MKALVHTKTFEFELKEVAKPIIKDNEVLIRVKAVGICGSDVHGMTGSTGRRKPPIIMGHEASGVIVEVGQNVKNCNVKDRVIFDSTIYCNSCSYCLSGRVNLCENRRVLGVSCDEYRQDGAMAEYIAVPDHILYHLPEGMTFQQGTMVEPLSIAFHAARRANIHIDDTVVVIGCGIIGLCAVQTARLAGAGRVIAVDIMPGKLQLAKKFGATIINASGNNINSEIMKIAGKHGVDLCFEAVGIEETVNTAISIVKKGGKIILIGNLSPRVGVPLQKIVTREIDISGSCASSGEYQACIGMISSGRIDIDSLISRVVPLKEGKEIFHALLENKNDKPFMKVILEP